VILDERVMSHEAMDKYSKPVMSLSGGMVLSLSLCPVEVSRVFVDVAIDEKGEAGGKSVGKKGCEWPSERGKGTQLSLSLALNQPP
jgi:hypothetical protein